MTEPSTIGLVAGSSVLAAFLTQASGIGINWLARRRRTSFSALYAALNLEAFTRACALIIDDVETYDASGGAAGRPHTSVPPIAAFSKEIDWDVLGIRYATDCLSNSVDCVNENIGTAEVFDQVDDDKGIKVLCRAAVRLGLRSHDLAKGLRGNYRVKALEAHRSDAATWLADKAAYFDKYYRRQERTIRNAE